MKEIRFDGNDLPQGAVDAEELRAEIAATLNIAASHVGISYMPASTRETHAHRKGREPESKVESIPAHLIVFAPDNTTRAQVRNLVRNHAPTALAETKLRDRAKTDFNDKLTDAEAIKSILQRLAALEGGNGPA